MLEMIDRTCPSGNADIYSCRDCFKARWALNIGFISCSCYRGWWYWLVYWESRNKLSGSWNSSGLLKLAIATAGLPFTFKICYDASSTSSSLIWKWWFWSSYIPLNLTNCFFNSWPNSPLLKSELYRNWSDVSGAYMKMEFFVLSD